MSSRVSTYLVVATLLVAALSGPVVAAETASPFDEKLSPTVDAMDGFWGYSVGEDVIKSDGQPMFYVTVEDGKLNSLTEWANSSTTRDVVATDNESSRALIAAQPADMLGGFWTESADVSGFDVPRPKWGDGLQERSYVVSIDVNRRMQHVEPVTSLENSSSYMTPPGARFAEYAADGEASFTGDGLAWDADANKSTIADVRSVTGVDDVRAEYDGTGVKIGIVDSGCNIQSFEDDPLFQDRVAGTYNSITGEENTTDAVADENGHGSWTCGATSADPNPNATGETYESVAPNSTLYVAKALSTEGSGSTQDIVESIEWAGEQEVDVLSLSLGSPQFSPTIAAELREFLERDSSTAVFVAVGNSRNSPTGAATMYISSPADVPEPGIVSVASTNVSSPSTAAPSYYSETGPDNGLDLSNGVTVGQSPDVALPGQKVAVATYTASGYRSNTSLSGTSMSTPVGAGIGALMLEANPQLRNESAAFQGYYQNTSSRMKRGGVYEVGHGMPNAANATSLTVNERTQEEARTDLAKSRDAALDAYSGSRIVKYYLDARSFVGGGSAA